MADCDRFLRSVPNPGSFAGRAASLRMARHEAVAVRGWDAHDDPRVRRDPRELAGPLDEAAFEAGMAASALSFYWHPDIDQTARQDALEVFTCIGDGLRHLDRVRGALMQFLDLPGPGLTEYPQGEMAQAALRFSLACDRLRAKLPAAPPAPAGTGAVIRARRFRDACSGLAAVLDSHAAGTGASSGADPPSAADAE